jgi:rubrerythrin
MKTRESTRETTRTNSKEMKELLFQALETELGGVKVYRAAIQCAQNEDLREEWSRYLEQTERHVEIVRGLFDVVGLDPEEDGPGRQIVREKGAALVSAMQKALKEAPGSAEIVAAECVVDAETKDHANWQLIGALSKYTQGDVQKALADAYDEVEDEEDEHLYHTKGWCRELWLDSLGLDAEMPPPEEEDDVKTALDEAKTARKRKTEIEKAGKKAAS